MRKNWFRCCKSIFKRFLKIEVDKDGNVDIYLRFIGDFGLDEMVLIESNESAEETEDKTTPNCHNYT